MRSDSGHQVERVQVDGADQGPRPLPSEPQFVIVCRGIIFVLMVLHIVGGPFYRQVLKGKSYVFRPWRMFHAKGLHICDVEFFIRHPDGRIEKIDHFKTLGYDDFLKAPPYIRRIHGEEGVLRVGRLIRAKVGHAADLRVNARIAIRQGWKPLYTDKRVE